MQLIGNYIRWNHNIGLKQKIFFAGQKILIIHIY